MCVIHNENLCYLENGIGPGIRKNFMYQRNIPPPSNHST